MCSKGDKESSCFAEMYSINNYRSEREQLWQLIEAECEGQGWMEVEEKMEVLLGQNSVMEGGEKIHSSCMEELPKEGDGQKKMDGIAGSYQFNI